MLLSVCLSCVWQTYQKTLDAVQSLSAGLVITAIMSELYPIVDYYHGDLIQDRYHAMLGMIVGSACGLLLMVVLSRMSRRSEPSAEERMAVPSQIFVTGANRASVEEDLKNIKQALDTYYGLLRDGQGDKARIDLQTRVLEAGIAKLRRSVNGSSKFLTSSYQNKLGSHLTVLKQYLKALEDDMNNIRVEVGTEPPASPAVPGGSESSTVIRAPKPDHFLRMFENMETITDSLRNMADGKDTSPQFGHTFWLRPPLSRIYAASSRTRFAGGPSKDWGAAWTMNSSVGDSSHRKSINKDGAYLSPNIKPRRGAIAPENSPRSSTYQSADALRVHKPTFGGASERTPLFLSTQEIARKTPAIYIVAVILDSLLDGYLIGITYVANNRAGYILSAATCLEMFTIGLLFALELRSGMWQQPNSGPQKRFGTGTLVMLLLSPPFAIIGGSVLGCLIGAEVKDDHPYLWIGFACFAIVCIVFFVLHELLMAVMARPMDRGFGISMWLFAGIWTMWIVDKLIPLPDDDP